MGAFDKSAALAQVHLFEDYLDDVVAAAKAQGHGEAEEWTFGQVLDFAEHHAAELLRDPLLKDCHRAFGARRFMLTRDLLALGRLPDSPWAAYGPDRRPLSARGLATLLDRHGIRAVHTTPGNGYRAADFGPAWARIGLKGGRR